MTIDSTRTTVPATRAAITAHADREPRPLADLPAVPGLAVPVRIGGADHDAVVLATADGHVDLVCSGQALHLPADTPATPVVNYGAELDLARHALAWVIDRHRASTTTLRAELVQAREEHTQVLDDIRGYAIARHVDGEICREGLNRFLTHFQLPPYPRRHLVSFVARGRFEVNPDDGRSTEDTADDVRRYLSVDTSRVDDADDSDDVNLDVDVTVDEPTDDD